MLMVSAAAPGPMKPLGRYPGYQIGTVCRADKEVTVTTVSPFHAMYDMLGRCALSKLYLATYLAPFSSLYTCTHT